MEGILVTRVALGAREGVNILTIVITFLARHVKFSPYRLGEVGACFGCLFLVWFLARAFFHSFLLSACIALHTAILAEVAKLSSFFI